MKLRDIQQKQWKNIKCKNCQGKMIIKPGRFGFFYGCENWGKNYCTSSFSCFQDTGRPFIPTVEQKYREIKWAALDAAQRMAFQFLSIKHKG